MSRIILVDEDDNEIGFRERSDTRPEDIYRVSGLWLSNSKGEVLLSKRSLLKQKNPGKWSCAAAGHVDEGETYLDNIIKEAEEELGLVLTEADLTIGPKQKVYGTNTYWITWHFAQVDKDAGDFVLQEEEVAEVGWYSLGEIRELLQSEPAMFSHGLIEWIEHILDESKTLDTKNRLV